MRCETLKPREIAVTFQIFTKFEKKNSKKYPDFSKFQAHLVLFVVAIFINLSGRGDGFADSIDKRTDDLGLSKMVFLNLD